jgi:hypothetical protein
MRRLRNMTITVEEDVARWARVRAAEENTSVSQLVGRMLRERMAGEDDYERAMKAFLSLPTIRLKKGTKLPRREELYDRPRIR